MPLVLVLFAGLTFNALNSDLPLRHALVDMVKNPVIEADYSNLN